MARLSSKDLKNYVALCTALDVTTEGGDIVLLRKDVLNTWAKVEAKQPSMFSKSGYAIMEERNRQTHLITIRARYDIEITSAAWIYEERMQSGARWYKVLGIKDDGTDTGFTVMSCRLVERGDNLVDPIETPSTENPGIEAVKQGVIL
jgi:head-tail adaptor